MTTTARGVYKVKYSRTKRGNTTFHHCLLVTHRDHGGLEWLDDPSDEHWLLEGTLFEWGSDRGVSSGWDKVGGIKEPRPFQKTNYERKLQQQGLNGKVEYDYKDYTYWDDDRIREAIELCGPSGSYNLVVNNCRQLTHAVVSLLTKFKNGLSDEDLRAECSQYRTSWLTKPLIVS